MVTASWSLQRAHHGEQPYWAVILLAVGARPDRPAGRRLRLRLRLGRRHRRSAAVVRRAGDGAASSNPINVTIPAARISDCLLHPGEPYDFNGKRGTYPDIRLVYWAGGNPFHHHQDLNRLRARLAAAGDHRRARAVVDRDRAPRRHRAAGDHVARAQRHRRRARATASSSRCSRRSSRSARRATTSTSSARWRAGSAAPTPTPRAATRWPGCATSTSSAGTAPAPTPRRMPDFDTFWEHGLSGNSGGQRGIRAVRRFPRRSGRSTSCARRPAGSSSTPRRSRASATTTARRIRPGSSRGNGSAREAAKTYPLHLVSSQPRDRLHSQMDCGPVSAGGKVAGREAIAINPADAAARGIRDGDVVRVHNERGACLAGAIVSDTVSAGVVQLSCGAWYDPADAGEQRALPARQCQRADARPGHLEARPGAELGNRAGRGRALSEPLPPVAAFEPPRVARRPLAEARKSLLPAGRHHADRRRGPARAEAAAVLAAAIKSRLAPAVLELVRPSSSNAARAVRSALLRPHRSRSLTQAADSPEEIRSRARRAWDAP